jgi:hypothetical protein
MLTMKLLNLKCKIFNQLQLNFLVGVLFEIPYIGSLITQLNDSVSQIVQELQLNSGLN